VTLPSDAILRLHAAAAIRRKARELKFDLVGIAPATLDPRPVEYLHDWLAGGQAGEMHYLHRRLDERTDPARYLPGAKTIVCVASNYHFPLDPTPPEQQRSHGKVARYALGDDYHEIIKHRLYDLADWIREAYPGVQTRCGVDSVPVMEKPLAQRAGIGWIGKNTCLIHPRKGSWLLLGEVLTTMDLPTDHAAVDRCGTCRRCIDACPTGAITGPYQLDARRCISYLTIEHAGPIDESLQRQMGDWLYGCDVCQDVCPFNRKAPIASDEPLRPRLRTGTLDLHEVLRWQPREPNPTLSGTAIKRVKLPTLQRNAAIVLQNKSAAR
jgi:epoxyqueuosine reductase